LYCDSDKCELDIKDDGKGFDVSKLTRVDKSGRGAGLFTMEERARLVGGSCSVKSQPGGGTSIAVKVALQGSMADAEDQGANS
jgi:signal transduction histidine kinase